MGGRSWTEAEDETLRTLYPSAPVADVLAATGRSYRACIRRAQRLGVVRQADTPDRRAATQVRSAVLRRRYAAGELDRNLPLGTESLCQDGYLWRKVAKGGGRAAWSYVHVLNWEAHNGPVPAGHVLRFKDGDRRNCDPANLVCVPRRAVLQENSVHNYPAEYRSAIAALAAFRRQLRKLESTDEGPE